MGNVLTEITPLSDKDCFYVIERKKNGFNYPIHQHKEFELNFVENAQGAVRVVGDSIEEIGQYDLALIGGKNLEHTWQQGRCESKNVREITIQFSAELLSDTLLSKNQFSSINDMLRRAEHGLCFSLSSIMKCYPLLNQVARDECKFYQFLSFLRLLYDLSLSEARVLSSSSFANAEAGLESDRIVKIKDYINANYNQPLRLNDLADLAEMTPTAFSRFFRLSTGRTLSAYIIEVKLGNAARMLVDSTKSISDICYECGFNNQSNFNRIFKANRGLTPRDFRAMYKRNKVLV